MSPSSDPQMPTCKGSVRRFLKSFSFVLIMSTLLSRGRGLKTALLTRTGMLRPAPTLDLYRHLSAITLLTNERVKAIMEGMTHVSPRRDTSNSGRHSRASSIPQCNKGSVHKMTLSELRMELSIRGMKTSGDRFSLVNRLMKALDQADETNHGAPQYPPVVDPEQLYLLRTKGHTTINSGGLGVGLALYNHKTNEELWIGRLYMAGDRTVFEAEYSAVILGMEYAHRTLGVRRLLVQTSCDVIVQQIRGVYKVNKQSLRMLLEREQELEREFDVFLIEDISPTENVVCKDLASKALATRKSVNVELDARGTPNLVDPIQNLNRIPTEDGRWKNPDPPSFSADIDPGRPYLLRFDGGSRGNPGVAGAGMVIYDDSGHEIWAGWKFHDEAATNNLAEYLGLLCGLKCARSLGIEKLIVEGDSQLIVRQLTGKYQCREESLKKFFHASKEVAKDFKYFEIRHIPRAENKRADWLANHAMDLEESGGFDQIQAEV